MPAIWRYVFHMGIFFLALASLLLASCASTELSAGGKLVHTVNKSPSNCEYLGVVSESIRGQIERETYGKGALGEIDLKNKTSEMGGNTVQVLGEEMGSLRGKAFRCSRQPASE